MQKTKQKGFTLVELIVVITILAILGTIAFISLQGYSKSSRNAKRTSDISNIKKSLELFSLNTGKYPIPDNDITVTLSGELLWTQGTIGENVTTNLSKNLPEKPTDSLYDIEYLYSTTANQKEYELMSMFEGEETSEAVVRVFGNYNELFALSTNYLIATPSIIGTFTENTEIKDEGKIDSLVINEGKNIPYLNISSIENTTGALDLNLSISKSITSSSSKLEKVEAIDAIKNAYLSTELENQDIYQKVLSLETYNEKFEYANFMLGLDNNYSNSSSFTDDDLDEWNYSFAIAYENGGSIWLNSIEYDGRELTKTEILDFEYLRIDNAGIIEIPESIGYLTNLIELSLIENSLTTIPTTIGNLNNLSYLRLDSNSFETIPEIIGNIDSLKQISFGNNLLTSLPISLLTLTNLDYLILSENTALGNLSSAWTSTSGVNNQIGNASSTEQFMKIYYDTTESKVIMNVYDF